MDQGERGSINLLLNVLVIEETSNINVRRAQLKFVLAHNPSLPPLLSPVIVLCQVLARLDSLTQGSTYFTTSSLPAETSDLRAARLSVLIKLSIIIITTVLPSTPAASADEKISQELEIQFWEQQRPFNK